jgi:alanine transaminase
VDTEEESGTEVQCISIINPGNPPGSVLTEPNIRSIFEIAAEKKLVVLADEVYQNNVFLSCVTYKRRNREHSTVSS